MKSQSVTQNQMMHCSVETNLLSLIITITFFFRYSAADRPLLWPKDWSTGLQADALAREPWKNPQWIDMM